MTISQRVDPDRVAVEVLDSLLEGCQVIDFDYRYVFVNSTVANQGRRPKEDLLGRTMMECYPGIDATPMFLELRRCLNDRTHHRMENEFSYPDGSKGWFELRLIPVPAGVCVLSMDITDRKRAEASLAKAQDQLRHAQKMDAVGRLAGGVAHDFNNMLSVMLSYATLARGSLTSNPAGAAEDIGEIEKAGQRAAELTKKLLSMSRQQPMQAKVLDLNELVVGMHGMFRSVLGSNIQLRSIPSESLGRILADPSQMEQVLLNLVVNARDAMPEGGKLTIETANVELDGEYAREHLGAMKGPHVMLAVSDTGIGMDKETQARIFEPFFTTKPAGKGTGIGLATVYGIVQQSNGSIWVYSEKGKGTTFKVYFPVASEDAPATAQVQRSPEAPGVNAQATVLVVEDDAPLRRLVAGILERAGYRVLVAADANEAQAIARRRAETIHVLLTDVMMPDLNGRELAGRLLALRPELKVLYMSGYTGEGVVERGVVERGAAFVEKPITPSALLRSVAEALAVTPK